MFIEKNTVNNYENILTNTLHKKVYNYEDYFNNIEKIPLIYINSLKNIKKEDNSFYIDEVSIKLNDKKIGNLILELLDLNIDVKLVETSMNNEVLCDLPAQFLTNFNNITITSTKLEISPFNLNNSVTTNNYIDTLSFIENFKVVNKDLKSQNYKIIENSLYINDISNTYLIKELVSYEYIIYLDLNIKTTDHPYLLQFGDIS